MEKIARVVDNFMQGLKERKESLPISPEACLKEAIPAEAKGHIKFRNFKNGIMYVQTDSSSWLYYLRLRQDKLTQDLRQRCPAVKDIRITVGD
jgi:hypothetical protein